MLITETKRTLVVLLTDTHVNATFVSPLRIRIHVSAVFERVVAAGNHPTKQPASQDLDQQGGKRHGKQAQAALNFPLGDGLTDGRTDGQRREEYWTGRGREKKK